MELKGSKTEANLWKAFAGESMARNKYTYFASKAKKEGFEQIAAIFEETAGNEKEHAKLWFKEFKELGGIGDTAANLKAAAAGENEEWTQMYKEMAETAKAEGFEKLAFLFEGVGKIEKEHEERYLTLLKNLEEGKVFEKDGEYVWKCRAPCAPIPRPILSSRPRIIEHTSAPAGRRGRFFAGGTADSLSPAQKSRPRSAASEPGSIFSLISPG